MRFTKCWATAKATQLWIILGLSFNIFNLVATWLLWSLTWICKEAVYLKSWILSFSKFNAIWKHLAASLKFFFCFITVPYVCQQNILAILLFASAVFAVTSALASYPSPSSNKAFIAFVYGWSGCIYNIFYEFLRPFR